MRKIMKRSVLMAAAVYVSLGLAVYFTFGEDTAPNFLLNNYHRSHAILFGTIAFVLAIIITIPLFLHTLRYNILTALGIERPLSRLPHALLSTFLVIIMLVAAWSTSNITQVLGILGATSNPIICYVLPAVFTRRIPQTSKWERYASMTIAVVLVITCLFSLAVQFKTDCYK